MLEQNVDIEDISLQQSFTYYHKHFQSNQINLKLWYIFAFPSNLELSLSLFETKYFILDHLFEKQG